MEGAGRHQEYCQKKSAGRTTARLANSGKRLATKALPAAVTILACCMKMVKESVRALVRPKSSMTRRVTSETKKGVTVMPD